MTLYLTKTEEKWGTVVRLSLWMTCIYIYFHLIQLSTVWFRFSYFWSAPGQGGVHRRGAANTQRAKESWITALFWKNITHTLLDRKYSNIAYTCIYWGVTYASRRLSWKFFFHVITATPCDIAHPDIIFQTQLLLSRDEARGLHYRNSRCIERSQDFSDIFLLILLSVSWTPPLSRK